MECLRLALTIYGPIEDDITGGSRKLHDELQNLYSLIPLGCWEWDGWDM
jgi:hypothetical protein